MADIGSTPSLVVGVGVGAALSAALEPALEVPKQKAWQDAPNRLPGVQLIAELVAGGKVTQKDGRAMAKRLGFDTGPFDSLTWLAQNRLDFPAMLRLWRLFPKYTSPSGKSIEQLVDETLAHENLDWDYHHLLTGLKYHERPGIGDIAYSVVRGYLPTNINLPVAPPSSGDYVPRFPQSKTLAEDLAKEIGFNENMLELMIARSGLSMAPIMAANALFRSNAAATINDLPDVPGVSAFTRKPYVGPKDYLLAISEGDLRTEWADAVKETAREILTAGQYAELQLRGFLSAEQRRALTHQHGMSDFDSDLLFDVLGRSLNVHQMLTGDRRMDAYGPPPSGIPDAYLHALQRENLRPEYYARAYANRHSLPSAFVVRSLLTDGALTEGEGENLYLYEGWPSDLAKKVATHYAAKASGGGADSHVTKALGKEWTTAQSSYIARESTLADVQPTLDALAIPAAAQAEIVASWDRTRALVRKQLTPAQIKKAYREQTFTLAQAIQMLLDRGYDQADATVLLEE